MRAIVIERPGGPEVLQGHEVPTPQPGRAEVRVRVRATAVNRADLLQRMGRYPAPADAPRDIPGLEFAGEIDALGEAVTEWKVGDRVFGLAGGGTYAEMVLAHERGLAAIPGRLGFEEAAAAPEAFITAHDALVTQAGMASGDRVLVHAAGSGVGTAAIQLARALGARPIGTARSAAKLQRVLELELGVAAGDTVLVQQGGRFADEVLEKTASRGVDVVLELVGGDYLAEDVRCAAQGARIVLVGMLAGARAELDLAAVMQRRLVIRGTMLRSRPLEEKLLAMRVFARHVVPLLDAGTVRPIVDRTFPLMAADEAHRYVASNEGFGKVVLTV
jgi:putative PIG3 family NAD(P)H quinone oxidoreductase